MTELLKREELSNGLILTFQNQSNRYFGDYHRVCIKVIAEISIEKIDVPADLRVKVVRLKKPLIFERSLERMGVAGADCTATIDILINDFMQTSRTYLENQDFPRQLLRKIITEQTTATIYQWP